MSATTFTIIVLLSICLSACGGKNLEKLDAGSVVLAFGDSLTAGKGVSQEHSYPSVLARSTRLDVVNEGLSGETTAEGLRRFEPLLDELVPDLVILMHGGNDILRGLNPTSTKANLQRMIDMVREREIDLVMIGIPEKKLFSSIAPFYRELADQYDLVLEDSIIASLLKKPGMKSDLVHFNRSGYKAIADELESLLKEEGAL